MSETVVYTLSAMERIQIKKDISYKTINGTAWTMDIYLPEELQKDVPRPAVIFIHGESRINTPTNLKDFGQYTSWGRLAAASGLIGVTFNHRASEEYTQLHNPASDIDDLFRYLRTQVKAIDHERLGIWTCSAAGTYGLYAALHDHPAFIRCMVAYYPVMDLLTYREIIPATVTNEVLEEFSARSYVKQGPEILAPLLLVRAGQDPAKNASIDPFVSEAIAHNIELELINYPQGQHAFDLRDDTASSRAIIQRTLAFLKEHLC